MKLGFSLVDYRREILLLISGIALVLISIFIVSAYSQLLSAVLNIAGLFIGALPTVYILYTRHTVRKDMERNFIEFLRDVTDSIESGMTLPLALEASAKRDYGRLTKLVKELSAQVNWGVPFEKALTVFARKTHSNTISRAIHTVIETYRVGGKVAATLNAVGTSLQSIEKIRQERVSSARAQLVTVYVIFAIFIVVMVLLQLFLIPQLPATGVSTSFLTITFSFFIIVQGFFAGLVAGKLSENSYSSGLKHSMIFVVGGYGLFILSLELAPLFT